MPEHFAVIAPVGGPHRLYFGDELLLETTEALALEEHYGGRVYPTVVYFSPAVTERLSLSSSASESRCPLKGLASYFGFRDIEDAVWTYRHPNASVEAIAGHLGFDTTKGFRVEPVSSVTS